MTAPIVWSLVAIVAVTACWMARCWCKRNAYWRRMDWFDLAGFSISAGFCVAALIGWVR